MNPGLSVEDFDILHFQALSLSWVISFLLSLSLRNKPISSRMPILLAHNCSFHPLFISNHHFSFLKHP